MMNLILSKRHASNFQTTSQFVPFKKKLKMFILIIVLKLLKEVPVRRMFANVGEASTTKEVKDILIFYKYTT